MGIVKTAAVAALLTAATASAHAAPYAYGEIIFSGVTLMGLTATNVASANVATSDNSIFPGYPNGGFSAGPTNPAAPLTQGSDAAQGFAGPGPFPAENTYTQSLLSNFGTRGDALLTGNLISGNPPGGANDVAEGRLAAASSAASSAGTSTAFNVVVSAPATSGGALGAVPLNSFSLRFSATDSLFATTSLGGEFASAQVNASFAVSGIAGTSTAGFTTLTYAPTTLNTSVSSTGGGANSAFNSGPTDYRFDFVLNPGTYQFSLLSGAQERLTGVPEPVSLALFGTGLAMLGLVRLRNRA